MANGVGDPIGLAVIGWQVVGSNGVYAQLLRCPEHRTDHAPVPERPFSGSVRHSLSMLRARQQVERISTMMTNIVEIAGEMEPPTR